jgi:hypothetical protein
MEIFHGDGEKIDKLNEILCQKAGFPSCYPISTQSMFPSNGRYAYVQNSNG